MKSEENQKILDSAFENHKSDDLPNGFIGDCRKNGISRRSLDDSDLNLVWYKFKNNQKNELYDFEDFKADNNEFYPSQKWHFCIAYYEHKIANNKLDKIGSFRCKELIEYLNSIDKAMKA